MRNGFVSTMIGLTASMFRMVGSVVIVFVAIGLALAVHGAFAALALLVPVWIAAMIRVIDWSFDL